MMTPTQAEEIIDAGERLRRTPRTVTLVNTHDGGHVEMRDDGWQASYADGCIMIAPHSGRALILGALGKTVGRAGSLPAFSLATEIEPAYQGDPMVKAPVHSLALAAAAQRILHPGEHSRRQAAQARADAAASADAADAKKIIPRRRVREASDEPKK